MSLPFELKKYAAGAGIIEEIVCSRTECVVRIRDKGCFRFDREEYALMKRISEGEYELFKREVVVNALW